MTACPICQRAAKARSTNTSAPFCSERCRQVDLGKWLNEDYAMPAEDAVPSDADGKDLS
jgi:endogenous inhibitor of DNA gyrase (YacG/DUF329 family)